MTYAAEHAGWDRLDPRYYRDRLEMIRRLEVAFPDVTNAVDSPWRGHPHAGIDVQTRWQLESGRAFPDGEGRATGWWAGVNYTLSVWPFLVAREHFSDELFEIEVRTPGSSKFEVAPRAAEAWLEHLETMRAVERAHSDGRLADESLRRRAPRLQASLWEAHLRSVRVGRRRHDDALGRLPRAERLFARTWGETTVEFLAALNFPTDELVSGYVNDFLPGFILHGRRIEGPANELTHSQRMLLRRLRGLHDYETDNGGRLLDYLRQAEPVLRDSGFYRHAYGALRRAITADGGDDFGTVLAAFFRQIAARRSGS